MQFRPACCPGMKERTTVPPPVMPPKAPSKSRTRLPISSAKGGPRPGIDITNSADLQGMDDLDYVERTKRLK